MIDTGNAARGLRENAGVVASDRATVFRRKDIEALFINPAPPTLIDLDKIDIQIPLLFVTCDPDSDGPSEMAIMSGFINTTSSVLPIGAHIVRILFFFERNFSIFTTQEIFYFTQTKGFSKKLPVRLFDFSPRKSVSTVCLSSGNGLVCRERFASMVTVCKVAFACSRSFLVRWVP